MPPIPTECLPLAARRDELLEERASLQEELRDATGRRKEWLTQQIQRLNAELAQVTASLNACIDKPPPRSQIISRRLNFHPAIHGFLFRNWFVNQMATIAGYGPAPTLGRCGGMAFAALDYFLGGIPIPQYTENLFSARVPPDGHWLADYIYLRLMHSFAVPSSSKYVHWTLEHLTKRVCGSCWRYGRT